MRYTMQDMRFAIRTFRKRPGFALTAILTLGLGIGGATAVFSVVEAVLLRPLPYRQPDRLVAIWLTSLREKGTLPKVFATYGDYAEFQRNARTLESVGVATWARGASRTLTGRGPSRDVFIIPASASFFETLGVPAAIGRTFAADDEAHGCSLVVAHKFWSSVLAADSSIIGRSLTLDQQPCTVLGVMPPEFSFYPAPTQAWMLIGPGFLPDLNQLPVGIFARLKSNVTLEAARAEMKSLYRPAHLTGETRDLEPLIEDLHGEFTFLAGRTLRATILVAFTAVMLVLLIACLNVANLLLARLSDREREFAIRAALGSGKARLVQQVLTESLLVSIPGAGLGVIIAQFAIRYFRSASPIELSVGANVGINLPALLFSVALAILTTLVFGLFPALRASQIDLTQRMKRAGTRRAARIVIAAEVALSFTLLIGAGLLMSSALRMGAEPLGFDPDHVLTTRVSLPASRYATPAKRVRFFDQLLEHVDVALGSKAPPDAGGNNVLEIAGQPPQELHDTGSDAVSPRFFEVLRIPLRAGRFFDAHDREGAQPVAIINEALAREYFGAADPLGQQIRIPGGPMPWLTIVGVVGNLKHTQLMNEMSWIETPIFYRPLAQDPRQSVQLIARAPVKFQAEIAALDPELPVGEIETLTARIAKPLAYPRFRATVLSFFAAAALLLCAIGLHGVISQLVSQRTREFGVRRALGAPARHLLALVFTQGGVPVLAGLLGGVAATLLFSRVLQNLLYGIKPADPTVLALVAVSMLAVAAIALFAPATRAARIDPMTALRED